MCEGARDASECDSLWLQPNFRALLSNNLTTTSIGIEYFHDGMGASKPETGISRKFVRVCFPHQVEA
ncbi:hypothetical protein C2E31_08885 [Rhodopirellula baltica]|nr:hypothetical protein C2E31_08885 [Rhodopirellula baltica]